MRNIPFQLLQNFKGDAATTALCWAIEKKNGVFIRGTEHDEDIDVPEVSPTDELSGTYYAYSNVTGSDVKSSSDMSVDNMEVEGALQSDVDITDLTVAEIEAGLLSKAPVTVFAVDWANPSLGYIVLRRGFLGEIVRDSDGKYKTEVRGFAQLLSQTIVQTFGERCNVVRFGNTKCKKNVTAITITATVTSVLNRKRFQVSGITTQPVGYFSLGVLRGLTGSNVGFEREIKLDYFQNVHGYIDLWDAMPDEVQIGDTFAMEPGCARTPSACIAHENIINFRGYGLYIPGAMALMKGPPI